MERERSSSADPPENTHTSICEPISHLSASNGGEETRESRPGFHAMSNVKEDTDNLQAPQPSPQPTSRPAQLRLVYSAQNLKA